MNPLPFILVRCAGWMDRQQPVVIEYLPEGIRVLKEQLRKHARLNDDQHRRLPINGQPIGHKHLLHIANLVTPDTRNVP